MDGSEYTFLLSAMTFDRTDESNEAVTYHYLMLISFDPISGDLTLLNSVRADQTLLTKVSTAVLFNRQFLELLTP